MSDIPTTQSLFVTIPNLLQCDTYNLAVPSLTQRNLLTYSVALQPWRAEAAVNTVS
jgi:hypothetical protein